MTRIQSIKLIQKAVGVKEDGIIGPKTTQALKEFVDGSESGFKKCKASSFADPADIAAYKKCKKSGKTELQCLAIGDNGIGQFGANTAQEHTPMCALHKDDMIERWGSVKAAAHKKVLVKANGQEVECSVEDRMSSPGRIDLNPAASKALKLKPPFLVDALWKWA